MDDTVPITEQLLCYGVRMARTRTYDLDGLLDAAERIAAESGAAAVTLRALTDTTGMSNGAIYHAFGSRLGVVGQAWLRAGRRFLDVQREAVDAALADRDADAPAVEAVVAAADAPAVFAERHPTSARLVLTVRRTDLLGESLPEDLARDLFRLDHELGELMAELATALWNRRDGAAVDVVHSCIVALPTGLLLHTNRYRDPVARRRLAAAVRAVLALGPETHTPKGRP